MKYTDPIAKSLTDTEYAGGVIFKQLVEEGTIVTFDEDIQKLNMLVFTLDRFCYTGKTTKATDVRAYILIDTPYPLQRSNIRLILCDGTERKTGKMKMLEVLPAPDPEYPIFGNDWMHKLSWFLKAEALGINLYDYIIARCTAQKYLTCGYDLRFNKINTPKERIIFLEEFWDLVDYVQQQTKRGSSHYGCQQRSRKYAEQLKKLHPRVKLDASAHSAYWGFTDPQGEFITNPDSLVAHVINYADDMIKRNDPSDIDFILPLLERIVKVNELTIPTLPAVVDCKTLADFKAAIMEAGHKRMMVYPSFNFNLG